MVEIKAWYDPDQEEPIALREQTDVDALVDRMLGDATEYEVGVVAELSRRDEDGWAILQLGVHRDRGYVAHADPSGGVVSWDGKQAAEMLTYDYMTHERPIQDNVEVSLSLVKQAARDFVRSGGARPEGVPWQPVED